MSWLNLGGSLKNTGGRWSHCIVRDELGGDGVDDVGDVLFGHCNAVEYNSLCASQLGKLLDD